MANFKVFTDKGGGVDSYMGNATYQLPEHTGGVLLVNSEGKRVFYSPTGWVRIEDPVGGYDTSGSAG